MSAPLLVGVSLVAAGVVIVWAWSHMEDIDSALAEFDAHVDEAVALTEDPVYTELALEWLDRVNSPADLGWTR